MSSWSSINLKVCGISRSSRFYLNLTVWFLMAVYFIDVFKSGMNSHFNYSSHRKLNLHTESRNMKLTNVVHLNSSGKLVHSMVAHLDAVTSLAVDPNGLYLMSGSK